MTCIMLSNLVQFTILQTILIFLVSNSCIKKIQDQINLDLKCLCKWLKANKISLNASKTKVLIFRHQNKTIMYKKKPEDKLTIIPCKIFGNSYRLLPKLEGNQVNIPTVRTKTRGANSIKSKSVNTWNDLHKLFIKKQFVNQKRNFC